MNRVVFDIETKNIFADVGSNDPAALDISVVGVWSDKTGKYEAFLEEEFPKMWAIFEAADILIGYNSLHFDLPLLNKYYSSDLAKIKHIDLLKEIKDSYGRRMKLDQVAEGTLKTNKSGHGLQAITWWKQGDLVNLKKYCLDDVKITKQLYDYARKHNELKFKEAGKVIKIPLKTESWEEKADAGMTFSLPF